MGIFIDGRQKEDVSESLIDIIDSAKLMQEAKTLMKILSRERCKNVLVDGEFIKKYGMSRVDLLPNICQHFYEKGLNDKK